MKSFEVPLHRFPYNLRLTREATAPEPTYLISVFGHAQISIPIRDDHDPSSREDVQHFVGGGGSRKFDDELADPGAQLLAAREACLDALEGKILCSAAREAFIEAAREAGINVGQQRI